jgi:hypothetical protein
VTFDCGAVPAPACWRVGSAAHCGSVTVVNSTVSAAVRASNFAWNAGLASASSAFCCPHSTLFVSRSVHSCVPSAGSPAYPSQTSWARARGAAAAIPAPIANAISQRFVR